MILAFDIGNSETTAALFDGDRVGPHWRLTTNIPRTPDEYVLLLRSLFQRTGIDIGTIKGSAICSVVPQLTPVVAHACVESFGRAPAMVDARAALPVKLEVDEPYTVGADRIANTLAASRLKKRDCIVVDLGTATTYDCITAAGAFIGGIIQPGVLSSAQSLFNKTAQLTETEIVAPRKVIGTRTDECIRSGVLYGAVDSVDGLVRRIKKEWTGANPLVIATGGLAETLRPYCETFDEVDPFLTLQGVRIAYELLTV